MAGCASISAAGREFGSAAESAHRLGFVTAAPVEQASLQRDPDAPRSIGFTDAVRGYFEGSVVFSGRASRREYWWVALFVALVQISPLVIVITGISLRGSWAAPALALVVLGLGVSVLLSLLMLLPSLSLTWRRLHDANIPGYYALVGVIPVVGTIVLSALALLPSRPGGARFDTRSDAAQI
ncbi:DUF805 domain-containing protein [Leucobacter sp. NPDC058333]|uniref:DUF805 domain-containing protein n=1 Tax=Leucobacter sp. NPDC058333 TaxID=3346450 RepID=UPI0036545426